MSPNAGSQFVAVFSQSCARPEPKVKPVSRGTGTAVGIIPRKGVSKFCLCKTSRIHNCQKDNVLFGHFLNQVSQLEKNAATPVPHLGQPQNEDPKGHFVFHRPGNMCCHVLRCARWACPSGPPQARRQGGSCQCLSTAGKS